MVITYVYTTDMQIEFDDAFTYFMRGSLDNAVNYVEWAFSEYNFTKAVIYDNNTGEVLVEVNENATLDFSDPFDDGDSDSDDE